MKRLFLVFAFLTIIVFHENAAAAVQLADSTCYECHEEMKDSLAKGTLHSPVIDGDCESCHEDHGDDEKLILTDEVPGLCYNCHDEMTKSNKHEPAAEGGCLDCHNVHSSSVSALLSDEVPGLCYGCHDSYGDKKSVHQPVSAGDCLDCHTSHESSQSSLLSYDIPELCGECHEDADHSKGKYPHEPVAGGECLECHNAHQSDNEIILTAGYSLKRYAMYKTENYSLCFNCHDQDPFESETAVDRTKFRNGDSNLHFLHAGEKVEVNKYGMKKEKEGMTCMGCHDTHGTEQAKLIRYTLECGPTFCYTLNYKGFEGGGTCVVGCHKPKVYKNSPEQAPDQDANKGSFSPVAKKNTVSINANQ